MNEMKKEFKSIQVTKDLKEKIEVLSAMFGKTQLATLESIIMPLASLCLEIKKRNISKVNLKTVEPVLQDLIIYEVHSEHTYKIEGKKQ